MQTRRIIESDPWLKTPAGRYVLAWEQQRLDALVADLFGFHALQLGWPALDALRANRMPHRWLQLDQAVDGVILPPDFAPAGMPRAVQVNAEFEALPFPAACLDLVVLAHTLELSSDPHQTLREVERVLVPEGRVVVLGFNPSGLFGLGHRTAAMARRLHRCEQSLPIRGEMIGWRRLRDWLRLLGFEMEHGRFGCFRPPFGTERWLERSAWMEPVGSRWWPVLGGVYTLQAVKRVRGMRLIGTGWKRRPQASGAPAVAVQSRLPQSSPQRSPLHPGAPSIPTDTP